MSYDARTLLIIGGFGCWILAAAIEFQAVRPSSGRVSPGAWTLGLLAQGMGLNLISQRGLVGDLWSISLASMLLLSTPLFFYAALQKVRGVETNRFLVAAVPVSVGILLPVVGFSDEAFSARAIVMLCASLFGLALSSWSAAQIARTGYMAGASMILVSGAVLALAFVAFVISVVDKEVSSVISGQGIQLAFYAINDICIFLGTLGYMDISRVLRHQLQQVDDSMHPDVLTGLYSRHAFMQSGREELQRARRRGYPMCALMIQIDHIGAVRASRGKAYADNALKRVAATILQDIRIYDLAGRVSADTVGVVMPELPLAGGLEVAERIRAKIAADPAEPDGAPRIQISVGLCEAEDAQSDLDALMAVAAGCLRRAQLEGGNCVVTPGSRPSKGFVEGTI